MVIVAGQYCANRFRTATSRGQRYRETAFAQLSPALGLAGRNGLPLCAWNVSGLVAATPAFNIGRCKKSSRIPAEVPASNVPKLFIPPAAEVPGT